MPRKSEVTTAQIVENLIENFGTEVCTEQVRKSAEYMGVSYATACKRLDSCLLYTSDAADE